MISDQIEKTDKTLEERGLPADSYFEVEFFDGSKVSEKNVNWSALCEKLEVAKGSYVQYCMASKFPIKNISIYLNGMKAEIFDIPESLKVYQFVRSERLLAKDINKYTLVGRGIGIIKNGSVVEERFINALENCVQGMRI